MRIEENFRDTKSSHYGLGVGDSLTRTPERMAILLLIAAIATLSIGLVVLQPTHSTDHQAMVSAADQCLYQAKKAGKNRIVIEVLK